VFQQVVSGEEPDRALAEVVYMLNNSASEAANGPRVDKIIRVIAKWASDNGIEVAEDGDN
jgi:hypothetical protein